MISRESGRKSSVGGTRYTRKIADPRPLAPATREPRERIAGRQGEEQRDPDDAAPTSSVFSSHLG